VNRPGQEGARLNTTPSKKSKDGLKGIISALAFCPSYEYSLFAAGSFTPTTSNIAIYNDDSPVLSIGGCPKAGVSQLAFSPFQPHVLLASFRQHEVIYAWDIRGNADAPIAIYDYSSPGRRLTNQRMRFDVSWQGNYLATGDQRGLMHIFDLNDTPSNSDGLSESDVIVRPRRSLPAHKDAVGSVSFNNTYPVIMSACGSRHFPEDDDSSDDDDDEEEEGSWQNNLGQVEERFRRKTIPWVEESSIGLWLFDH
jgi:WD40 repeat protein